VLCLQAKYVKCSFWPWIQGVPPSVFKLVFFFAQDMIWGNTNLGNMRDVRIEPQSSRMRNKTVRSDRTLFDKDAVMFRVNETSLFGAWLHLKFCTWLFYIFTSISQWEDIASYSEPPYIRAFAFFLILSSHLRLRHTICLSVCSTILCWIPHSVKELKLAC